MLCEFVGLPAAGKSWLIKKTIALLGAQGFDIHTLAELADEAMEDAKQRHRFIRNKPERTALYGCFQLRAQYRDIFDHFCASPLENPGLLMWSMELLSQYHFAKDRVATADLVFCDEGLLDRGVANFIGRTDLRAFEAYNTRLPSDFLVVNVMVPKRVSVRRSLAARNKLPCSLWFDDRDALEVLEEMDQLTKHAIAMRKARGLPVIDLDGRAPVDDNAQQLAQMLPKLIGLADAA